MYDIVFISYEEPNADEVYAELKARFPMAKRVHGVEGIHQAHIAAAKKCFTKMFWVVDGDAKLKNEWQFDYIANEYSTVVYPSYISYFFKHLHDSWCVGNQSYVRTLVEQRETFCQALEVRIKEMCNLFLGLNDHTEFVW